MWHFASQNGGPEGSRGQACAGDPPNTVGVCYRSGKQEGRNLVLELVDQRFFVGATCTCYKGVSDIRFKSQRARSSSPDQGFCESFDERVIAKQNLGRGFREDLETAHRRPPQPRECKSPNKTKITLILRGLGMFRLISRRKPK